MAAWTEDYTDLSARPNIVGDIVSKVLAARKLAEEERNYAQKQLDAHLKRTKQVGTKSLADYGIGKGYFFKKALGHEFGGDRAIRTKEKLDFYKNKINLLKQPRKNFWKLFDKQKRKTKQQRFREKFKYREGFEYIDSLTGVTPILTPQTLKLPPKKKGKKISKTVVGTGSAKKIQKATTGSGSRVSKEELFSVLTELVSSLEKTATSLKEGTANNSNAILKTAELQSKTLDSLKYRENLLEDKLDRLISAIENQTTVQKGSFKKAKVKQQENQLELQNDVATAKAFDDLTTKENESITNAEPVTPITNIQNVNIGATSSQRTEHEQMEAYGGMPKFETGGIYSGPDSGYLAKLNKGDRVIPLDNNYTQGEPSAVDGKVRKMPMRERGTPVGGKFGFGITNMTGISKGGTTEASAMSQPLVDAMSLPMMATGGTILATVSKLVNSMGSQGETIAPEIEKLSRPIADVFGLPASITQKAKMEGKKSASTIGDQNKSLEGESKKNIVQKMLDGFSAFLESLGKKIDEDDDDDDKNPKGKDLLLPGNAPPEIKALMETISGGEGGPNSVQGIGEVPGLSDLTIDQAIAKAKSYIGKGSTTGALGAYQFHSDYLRERAINAGLDPTKDKFSFENQTKIMRHFMVSLYGQSEQKLVEDLRAGKLESKVFPKLSRDAGWPSLPGGSQPNVHTAKSAKRYEQNLKKYQSLANTQPTSPSSPIIPSSTSNPSANLGQKIPKNYGMNTHDELSFVLAGKNYKAHKTEKGYDFYEVTSNPLDVDFKVKEPERIKILTDAFVNMMESRQQKPPTPPDNQKLSFTPPSTSASLAKAEAISKPANLNSNNVVALLNAGGNSMNNTASTASPPSQPKVAPGQPIGRDLYPSILPA